MSTQDTRTQLLQSSYELMLSKGYAATSVNEICSHAGVSKGSFYHCFKSKQHCALEMIKHHVEEAERIVSESLDLSGLSGVEAAMRYVEHIRELSEDLFRDGCLVGAFALELAETNPKLRRRVSQIFDKTTEKDSEMLKPLSEAYGQTGAPSARELAEQMLMIIEGGVVLSKAYGEPGYVSKGLRCFLHYLELLSGAAVASRR